MVFNTHFSLYDILVFGFGSFEVTSNFSKKCIFFPELLVSKLRQKKKKLIFTKETWEQSFSNKKQLFSYIKPPKSTNISDQLIYKIERRLSKLCWKSLIFKNFFKSQGHAHHIFDGGRYIFGPESIILIFVGRFSFENSFVPPKDILDPTGYFDPSIIIFSVTQIIYRKKGRFESFLEVFQWEHCIFIWLALPFEN